VTALAAGAFCAWMWQAGGRFPEEKYAQEAESLRAQAETRRAETAAAVAAQEENAAALRSDLRSAGEEGAALAERLTDLRAEQEEKAARLETLTLDVEGASSIYERMLTLRKEYAQTIRQLEEKIVAGESDVKICYWTLDDGPTYHTQQFLDAAREMGVYVTFFTSREANDSAYNDDPAVERDLLRQEAMAGHAIQNHSNSHQYSLVAGNLYTMGMDSFKEQVLLQDEWIYECTGLKPDIFRFPGGSAHAFSRLPREEVLAFLEENGYVWIDWSCDIFDNARADQTAQTEYANAVYEVKTMDIAVLLSHDWNANTLSAFQRAVPVLKEAGYVFLPLFSESWTIGNTEIVFS